MSTPASQLMLRHGRLFARKTTIRHASTTAEAAQAASNTLAKSKEIASEVTSKASDGLTRVQSSSGTALSRVARGVNRTFGAIGNRAGRLIVFSTSLIPPTVYYSRVGFELGKLVYRGQKWNPPNLETLGSFWTPISNSIRGSYNSFIKSPIQQILQRPRALFSILNETANSIRAVGIFSRVGQSLIRFLGRIRNIGRPQLISTGIIVAEVLGFFTVGEMIGRGKIVGYRGEIEHGEHH